MSFREPLATRLRVEEGLGVESMISGLLLDGTTRSKSADAHIATLPLKVCVIPQKRGPETRVLLPRPPPPEEGPRDQGASPVAPPGYPFPLEEGPQLEYSPPRGGDQGASRPPRGGVQSASPAGPPGYPPRGGDQGASPAAPPGYPPPPPPEEGTRVLLPSAPSYISTLHPLPCRTSASWEQ